MDIQIEQVDHTYPGRPPRAALAELSLFAPSGQFVALVGPSGCGKSTLLRLAAGLLQPTRGRILLGGRAPEEAIAARQVAWMAQSPALLPWLTARDNVALATRLAGQTPAVRTVQPAMPAEEALERVGLGDAASSYPMMLSGGMQQRVALARTLSLPARVWLMDEPFAALDELTRERLTAEMLDLWRPLRPTVLWVTHNLHEALRLADRVLVLSPRPARVAADFPVDLPYPRDESDPALLNLLRRLRRALQDG